MWTLVVRFCGATQGIPLGAASGLFGWQARASRCALQPTFSEQPKSRVWEGTRQDDFTGTPEQRHAGTSVDCQRRHEIDVYVDIDKDLPCAR